MPATELPGPGITFPIITSCEFIWMPALLRMLPPLLT